MLPSQQKDLFGNSTNQVENYDKFRPVYPKEFFDIILKHCISKESYLDVACGTGQLLFELSPHFSRSEGIDISPKQIQVTVEKIKQKNLQATVSAHVCDAHSLQGITKEHNLPLTYDLVSIGQALHWFDVQKFFQEVSQNILTSDNKGVFAVAGYFCQGFDFALDENNSSQVEEGKAIYDKFYDIVKGYFDCDRDNLSKAYAGYDFSTQFQEIDSKQILTSTPCTLFEMTKYLKTYSAYNTYLEAKKGEVSFADPTEVFEKECIERINEIQKKTGTILSNPLRMNNFYFLRLFKKL